MNRYSKNIGGIDIDVGSWDYYLDRLVFLARKKASAFICICNVHMFVTSFENKKLQESLRSAKMVTPDGFPVAWLLAKKHKVNQKRISGPDFMEKIFEIAEKEKFVISFYGGTENALSLLVERAKRCFPNLNLGVAISPPFAQANQSTIDSDIEKINSVNTDILFVGLGCPKQEIWMLENSKKINGVLLGVGAAFDYYSGLIKRAPIWAQSFGLEWLFRLISEPRRLWRRYFYTNTKFFFIALKLLFLK